MTRMRDARDMKNDEYEMGSMIEVYMKGDDDG
jgi:hypothetical protein